MRLSRWGRCQSGHLLDAVDKHSCILVEMSGTNLTSLSRRIQAVLMYPDAYTLIALGLSSEQRSPQKTHKEVCASFSSGLSSGHKTMRSAL